MDNGFSGPEIILLNKPYIGYCVIHKTRLPDFVSSVLIGSSIVSFVSLVELESALSVTVSFLSTVLFLAGLAFGLGL